MTHRSHDVKSTSDEATLKAVREKDQLESDDGNTGITSDLFSETLRAKKGKNAKF